MAQPATPGEFKTAAFGFKKAQVLAYIDELSARTLEEQKRHEEAAAALQSQLDALKADNDLLVEKTREVCERLTQQEKRAEEAECRAKAAGEQLLHMEETANSYKSRLFTREQETVVLRSDNARLTQELEEQHRQLEEARARLEALQAESEELARRGREDLARQQEAFEQKKQEDARRLEEEKQQAERQVELERARIAQAQRAQQESARESARQMADTVLLLRSQLEQVDRQIADAAERLQRATGAIYAALGETEENLQTLGAQADSFPKPLAASQKQEKARPRAEKRPPRPHPPRPRTLSEGLLDLLERTLKD